MAVYREATDHMGFAIEEEAKYKLHEQSQSQYLKILAKRSHRWKTFIRLSEHKYNTNKLRRFIRKGVPNEYRPLIWMKVTGAEALMQAHPALYKSLLSKTLPTEVVEAIDIDIPRTFPNNVYYKDEPEVESLRPALRRVLTAFALHNPQIGYCQGLNYVAAVMLLVLRDEQKAFWLLDTVTTKLLPDYYVNGPVAMSGLQTDLIVLSRLVKEKAPAVDTMMRVYKVDMGLVCTKWFVCLFVDTLPIETVLRVWDAFFNEGRKVLFRVALTLVKKGEVTLLSCTALHHIVKAFITVSSDTYTWYSHNFMKLVYEESGDISSQYLNEITKESLGTVLNQSHNQKPRSTQ